MDNFTGLLLEQHNKHKTKGYHYLANLVHNKTDWIFSDNLVHKCCKLAGIRSETNRVRKIAEINSLTQSKEIGM